MRFVTFIISCTSSFQSLGLTPGRLSYIGMWICIEKILCQRRKLVSCIPLCISLSGLPNVLGTTVATECFIIVVSWFKIEKETKVFPLLHTCRRTVAVLLCCLWKYTTVFCLVPQVWVFRHRYVILLQSNSTVGGNEVADSWGWIILIRMNWNWAKWVLLVSLPMLSSYIGAAL